MRIKIESEIKKNVERQNQETDKLFEKHIPIFIQQFQPICAKNCKTVQDCDGSCRNQK
jgi:hypothetical protein